METDAQRTLCDKLNSCWKMRIKKVLWDREDHTFEDRARAEEKQQVFKDREDHVLEFCAHTEKNKQQAFPDREVMNFVFL